MKNRRQNVMRFIIRILSIPLLFGAMLAVSPRQAMAQTSRARCTECDEILEQIKREKDYLIRLNSERAVVRNKRGETDVELRSFPERRDQLQKFQTFLRARETELDKSIADVDKTFDALLNQLAGCCCPKDKKTTEGPDVPGLDEPDVPGLEEKVGMTPFKPNQAVGLFSIIREDSTPRFNTYGVNGAYTRFINSAVGITGDFNAHFREQNGMDLSKLSALGGVTFVPFEGAQTTDKATVSLHALVGLSRFRADSGVASFTDTAATVKLGGALDVNVSNNFFFRLGQFDYAPTKSGGETQHNFQVGVGAGVRWK